MIIMRVGRFLYLTNIACGDRIIDIDGQSVLFVLKFGILALTMGSVVTQVPPVHNYFFIFEPLSFLSFSSYNTLFPAPNFRTNRTLWRPPLSPSTQRTPGASAPGDFLLYMKKPLRRGADC